MNGHTQLRVCPQNQKLENFSCISQSFTLGVKRLSLNSRSPVSTAYGGYKEACFGQVFVGILPSVIAVTVRSRRIVPDWLSCRKRRGKIRDSLEAAML